MVPNPPFLLAFLRPMTPTHAHCATTGPAPDLILIRDFQIDAVIGIEPHERLRRQPLVLHLDLQSDVKRAAASDHIDDALNYDALSQRLRHYVEASEFHLIETLAERVAALIIDEFAVPWLRLELRKPHALPGSTDVGLVIERGRADQT